MQPINYPSVARGAERLRIAPTPAHAPSTPRRSPGRSPAAPVGRVSLNHVALSAHDLERSTRFYEQLFGCARLAVPDVGFPTVWLSRGDRPLHLVRSDPRVSA